MIFTLDLARWLPNLMNSLQGMGRSKAIMSHHERMGKQAHRFEHGVELASATTCVNLGPVIYPL